MPPERMTAINSFLTNELVAAIDYARGDEPRAVFLERELRTMRSVEAARKSLKLKYRDRPPMGRKKTS